MNERRRDTIFATSTPRAGDFEFDEHVADVFDEMLARSIPLYTEQQDMIANIATSFWRPGSEIYDLGCSTATTLIRLGEALPHATRLVGYDKSAPMLDRARQKVSEHGYSDRIDLRLSDLNGTLEDLPLHNASIVTMCWTLQFIRPMRRDSLIRWIWNGLVDGGVLIVTEKVLTHNADLNRLFVQWYYAYKSRQGYSETEIVRKREALENVLVPYRLDENRELFARNGFGTVETFFQWFNFAGFLCVKSGSRWV